MIREERVKREKRVQILGASACAEAYNTGVSGSCLVLSALMRFLFLVFIKSFSLFKRYCPLWVPGSLHFLDSHQNIAPLNDTIHRMHQLCIRWIISHLEMG